MAQKPKDKPKDILQTFSNEFLTAQYSPRFQIILTNAVLELLVNTLVEQCCKNGKKRMSYSFRLLLLNEKGLITDSQYRWMDAFRDLRNDAAHGGQFNFTADMVKPFKDMPGPHTAIKMDDPKQFVVLCHTLVFRFWSDNEKILKPYFEPKLFGEAKRQQDIFDALSKAPE
jgi:hypothetical protein